ncbi:6-phosphogluconate dehydrogenase [Xylariaceae sp. FL0016]|nr:6-phosphogluconate dehydrogenase [Xylariaceae sp. FL0016]
MPGIEVKKVGMLGVGSMGAMMTLLMAEKGYEVFYYDPNDQNLDTLEQQVKDIKLESRAHRSASYDAVCEGLGASSAGPKVFMFSTPHGTAADKCIEGLRPHLGRGDVIIDCGNEHFARTEARQRALQPDGVHYVGCGVSGGYQAARAGPSLSPGGSAEALDAVMPFLRSLAARDDQGNPCTAPVGPAGSGHYIKMVHNGIEQGMMSVVAEAWLLMTEGLGLSHEEIGTVFASWNAVGPLRECFLVGIGADVSRARHPDGTHVVAQVRDKVVQDVDEEEGTGTWTCQEAVARHVPAASILSAHLFRCASADLARRIKNRAAASRPVQPGRLLLTYPTNSLEAKASFLELLHKTVYFCFLCCFAQGLDLIREKDKDSGWSLSYANILQLWRGGCIIRAEAIAEVLASLYARPDHDPDAILSNSEVGEELGRMYPAVKQVVVRAVESDLFVPAISQTLEYYKYETSTQLPTQFMEAQLDYFGQHMFDRTDDPVGGPTKGKHHFEWKPAKETSDH